MAKKVRDAIHGYIYLTKIEEAVSQHPLFLRLHYIHQTSFTYLTYPNAHSTRYPHSLGVMHVASEIFLSAIRNSPSTTSDDLAAMVCSHIGSIRGDSRTLAGDDNDLLAGLIDEVIQNNLAADPVYSIWRAPSFPPSVTRPGVAIPTDAKAVVPLILLYQAIRLAALVHDMGHPPFSHIVEYSLLDALPGRYLGHEVVGLKLFDELIVSPDLRVRSAFKTPIFSEMALRLARLILKNDQDSSFYGLKKSLLDGPIDADRLDYVRRDAYSAGLNFTYDMRRLVDAAFVRKYDGSRYEIGYQPNCLSSFENFFVARYDLYRWMIYHHDVVRRNLAMQRTISIILNGDASIRQSIKDIGKEIIEAACGDERSYRRFTDSFLLDKLWLISEELDHNTASRSFPDEEMLRFFLSIILARRNDLLRSILKRPDEYNCLAHAVLKNSWNSSDHTIKRESTRTFNEKLKDRFKYITESIGQKNENRSKVIFAREIENAINGKIAEHAELAGVCVFAYYIGTFQAGSDKVDQVDRTDVAPELRRLFFSSPRAPLDPVWVQSVSPTLVMLHEAWLYSPQLVLFYAPSAGGRFSPEDTRYDMLMKSITQGLHEVVTTK